MQTIDHFDSTGWFNCDKAIFQCVLCVCWQNSIQNLSNKKIVPRGTEVISWPWPWPRMTLKVISSWMSDWLLTSHQVSLRSDKVDFWQSLKSRDSITRRKLKNPARDFRYFGLVSETVGIFLTSWKLAEEIDFENRHFWNLKLSDLDPDLGWPWKSYCRECLIDHNKYHYLVCGCIESDCGQTHEWTFLLDLLGHLSRDDLKGKKKGDLQSWISVT